MRTKYKLCEIAIYINWYNINCEIPYIKKKTNKNFFLQCSIILMVNQL